MRVPKGHPEGKILAIDTVSQNRLNVIKNVKFEVNFEKVLWSYESFLRGYPQRKCFRSNPTLY